MDGIDDIASAWAELGLERQRAVIGAVLADVTVEPAVSETGLIPSGSRVAGAPREHSLG